MERKRKEEVLTNARASASSRRSFLFSSPITPLTFPLEPHHTSMLHLLSGLKKQGKHLRVQLKHIPAHTRNLVGSPFRMSHKTPFHPLLYPFILVDRRINPFDSPYDPSNTLALSKSIEKSIEKGFLFG